MGDETSKFDVGYGKPPTANQFKPGQSGNPKGRAKGSRNKVPSTTSLEFGSQPANQMLLQEAYRPVTIREGEKVIALPAIQAVFRAMGVSAMKGNRLAQRTMAELVQQIETEDREMRCKYIESVMEYKTGWEENIEWARARNIPEPEPIPHPDDIIIDFHAPAAFINGPKTKQEKERWGAHLKRRQDAQEEVTLCAQRFNRARDPKKKERWLDWWHHEQKMFDIINDNLPERYRTKLQDRSWKEGASRAGDQKRHTWPGER
jgi:hypothetical protein